MLRDKGIRQSMSRKSNFLDDEVIENFFALPKSELLYLQEFQSIEQFKAELMDCYNNHRSKGKLKAGHLRFTDNKPFRLLNLIICLTFCDQFKWRTLS